MKQPNCSYCKTPIKALFDRQGVCFSCEHLSKLLEGLLVSITTFAGINAKARTYWIDPLETHLYQLKNKPHEDKKEEKGKKAYN